MNGSAVLSSTDLPRLSDIGPDLLTVRRSQQVYVVVRPVALIVGYALLAAVGWWVPALVALAAVFPAMVAVVHDLLHRSLGLSAAANRRWLTIMGILVLQSGHAIQATHLEHHRRFPNDDDPEAYVAGMPFRRAVLEGPVYPVKLWRWARHQRPEIRRRVVVEAAGHAALGLGSVALLPGTPIPFVYVGVMFIGCSLFPAVSVNLLHRADGETPLDRTRTVRGVALPLITLGSGYHLEHHLYPRVPSANYRRLARRLRPTLDRYGVDGFTVRRVTRSSCRGR